MHFLSLFLLEVSLILTLNYGKEKVLLVEFHNFLTTGGLFFTQLLVETVS